VIRLGMEDEKEYEEWNAVLLEHIESISVPDSRPRDEIPNLKVRVY
jgi:hypothetical protein